MNLVISQKTWTYKTKLSLCR